jgi:pimeloyl-ACP methyl ester carboxylesterase
MAKHPLRDLVIVIPGILGSTLGTKNANPLWAVTRRRLLPALGWLALNKKLLTLPSDTGDGPGPDEVTSTGMLADLHSIPHLWTIDGYTKLVDHLSKTFDLTESAPGRPGNFVKFHYDWRLSNRFHGRRLAVEAAEHLHAWRRHSGNTEAKIIVIGHSMGGVIARWFLDVEGGHAQCRKLITIGTPYQGAPKAIDAIVNGVHKGFGPIGLDLTDFVRSLPSVHQLLPVYPCVGTPGSIVSIPTKSGLAGLTTPLACDAAMFHEQLATAAKLTTGSYPVFAIKGQFQPTPQVARIDGDRVKLDSLEDGRHHYCRPGPDGTGVVDIVNMQGDGTVPRGSAHPSNWANEDDRDAGAHTQGFTAGHAHVQNAGALFDSIDQILTADRLGLSAAGGGYGLSGSEVIAFGDTFRFQATGDALRRNPPLVALIDGDQTNPIELDNHGDGVYTGTINGLSEDAHVITVYSKAPLSPVDITNIIVTVVPESYDLNVVAETLG